MSPTPRTTAQRHPERVTYDREAAYAVLDEALAVHVGCATEDGPVVVPTLHLREGDRLLLHGSAFGRFMTTAAAGAPLCVTATLIDGVIFGRASSHHSAAYRCVMVFGQATAIENERERADALAKLVESVVPGRPMDGDRLAARDNWAVWRGVPYPCWASTDQWPLLWLRARDDGRVPEGLAELYLYLVEPERVDAWYEAYWTFRWRGEPFRSRGFTSRGTVRGSYEGDDEEFARLHLRSLDGWAGDFPLDELTDVACSTRNTAPTAGRSTPAMPTRTA